MINDVVSSKCLINNKSFPSVSELARVNEMCVFLLPGNHLLAQDDRYWDSACSSDSPHPNDSPLASHHYLAASPSPYYANSNRITASSATVINNSNSYEVGSTFICDSAEYITGPQQYDPITGAPLPVIKRRKTANKKERRRTQSINSAYLNLREKIPNVPQDTKLSKIKTLRLAKTYISYLVGVLQGEQDPQEQFRPELVPSSRKINAERKAQMQTELQVGGMLREGSFLALRP